MRWTGDEDADVEDLVTDEFDGAPPEEPAPGAVGDAAATGESPDDLPARRDADHPQETPDE